MEVTSSKKEIWTIGSYSLLTLSIMVGYMYLNLFATEVLKVSADALAVALLVAKTIDFIVSVLSGALIEKIKLGNKGKNQEWLAKGRWVAAICIAAEVFPTQGPQVLKLLVLAIAYTLLNCLMNFIQTAYYGIMGVVAGPNMANRNAMSINMTRQGTVVSLICSFIPTLVTKLPCGQWNYFVVAVDFCIPMPFALGAIAKLGDGKDIPVGGGTAMNQITVKDMIRALTENSQLLALFIHHCVMYIGTYVTSGIAAYYWIYVVGDMSKMTISSLIGAIVAIPAAMFFPKIGQKLGKKKAITIGYAGTIVIYIVMFIVARYSYWYLIACTIVSYCVLYTYSAFSMLLYMDAGEWFLDKTGKDTRGIVMGLASPPMKIGMAIGGTLGLKLLASTGFGSDEFMAYFMTNGVASAEWTEKFLAYTYLTPAITTAIALVILLLFYKISDQEAADCAKRNMDKMMAAMAAQQGAPEAPKD